MGDFVLCRIQLIHTVIFCPDPQILVLIHVHLSYDGIPERDACGCRYLHLRRHTAEMHFLFRMHADSLKITAGPYISRFVFEKRVNSIIRQAVFYVGILDQVFFEGIAAVINVDAGFTGDPKIISVFQYVPYIQRTVVVIKIKNMLLRAGYVIISNKTCGGCSRQQAVPGSFIQLFDPPGAIEAFPEKSCKADRV